MFEERVKEYIQPVRIVEKSQNITNVEYLLEGQPNQIYLAENHCMKCIGEGYLILDFGKEICGGIRVLSSYLEGQKCPMYIRVRFGESLTECCAEIGEKNATNDHAVRDQIVLVPNLSDFEVGQTGFRFVRIDFLTKDKCYVIKKIYGTSTYRDLPYIGNFECDDSLVNEIYRTARRTLHLNMQSMLWDGIKRDRLVWIGDMQPEVLGITDVWGESKLVEECISQSEKSCPLPDWFGKIPTYSAWYMQIICDYYLKTGKKEFLQQRLPYIYGVVKQFYDSIDEQGNIDYNKAEAPFNRGYFVDWPSSECGSELAESNRYLLLYVFRNIRSTMAQVGEDVQPFEKVIEKLEKQNYNKFTQKQLLAFKVLTEENCTDYEYSRLTNGGAKGMSTYMSYFILKAVGKTNVSVALDMMKQYYGGMLDKGATSFWEDFDIDWINGSGRIDEFPGEGQKDIHGDYGKYCYKGFRHSLCHGWSCGPIQFLTECVAGISVTGVGCTELTISPKLGNLHSVKCDFPTPYGKVTVDISKNGKQHVSVNAPKQVKIIINND